ncbi:N-acetylmuramoyl-L-alanine amidase [Coxiella endosymbiont of Amblyomma nuttalli]|uniref:N-acetylmuramoyl-L-alanine amidase n=1 Tax=Coxiella endosymbiont of Amblyomma nuttalli TaxID=2749996 RepID=UPI001BA6B3E3|nr:N-acetylmuramoyl-L-alanine amidase [Coxiella endosymbiont of Amblyomma nuttalli]QTS83939.1 N-acetylmuramoyl-L-alanine amidase AmiC precursor [Coxiella endosymbiont of Amblyomma nuttalli]
MQKWWIIFCLWLLCYSSALADTNKFNKLYVYSNVIYYQIIFNMTSLSHYHYFILTNPNRLVFDIQSAILAYPFSSQLFRQTPIRYARTSVDKNHMLRIVFDLKYPMKAIAFTLRGKHKNSFRLVIELSAARPCCTNSCADGVNIKKKNNTPVITSFRTNVSPLPYRSSNVIVVIDPGHGGRDLGHGGHRDPGATGPGGSHEKDIVLKISRDLQRDINQQPGFKAYLTRNGDYYLTLRRRLAIARHYKADMFIAIHTDACQDHKAQGASVFTLSSRGATTEAARWLKKREHESELIGGVNLNDKNTLLKSVLINLSQTATIHTSLLIGKKIIHSLSSTLFLHHHYVKQAAFVVLKSPDIASLLVETGFISNRYEEHRLLNHIYQQRIAFALMQGIRDYFIHNPPMGTWLSKQKFNKVVLIGLQKNSP